MRVDRTHSGFDQFRFIFRQQLFGIRDADQEQCEFHIRLLKFFLQRVRFEEFETVQKAISDQIPHSISDQGSKDFKLLAHTFAEFPE